MGVLQQFNALIWSWAEMLRALRRRVALVPFGIYAAVQSAVLLVFIGFTVRPLSWFVPGLMSAWLGPRAVHYPNNLIMLRAVMGRTDIVLSVVLGGLVAGAAAYLFSAFYSGSRERFPAGWRAAVRRYVPILAVALLVTVVAQAIVRIPMSMWGHFADVRPLRFRLLRMVLTGTVILVQALFVYVIPAIVIDAKRWGAAVAGSMALAVRTPITTLFVVGVPAAVELLPAWLMRNSNVIVYRFAPELLILGMFLWIVTIAVINYATVGSATRFYLHATQIDEPAERAGEGAGDE
jgi:hypothetical protein